MKQALEVNSLIFVDYAINIDLFPSEIFPFYLIIFSRYFFS